jgi:hypothetical protein
LENHYEVLGVEANASADEIRAAYLELAKRYHPDQSPSRIATRLMAKINEAYRVLGNPDRRADYDQRIRGNRRATPEAKPNPSEASTKERAPNAEASTQPRSNSERESPTRAQAGESSSALAWLAPILFIGFLALLAKGLEPLPPTTLPAIDPKTGQVVQVEPTKLAERFLRGEIALVTEHNYDLVGPSGQLYIAPAASVAEGLRNGYRFASRDELAAEQTKGLGGWMHGWLNRALEAPAGVAPGKAKEAVPPVAPTNTNAHDAAARPFYCYPDRLDPLGNVRKYAECSTTRTECAEASVQWLREDRCQPRPMAFCYFDRSLRPLLGLTRTCAESLAGCRAMVEGRDATECVARTVDDLELDWTEFLKIEAAMANVARLAQSVRSDRKKPYTRLHPPIKDAGILSNFGSVPSESHMPETESDRVVAPPKPAASEVSESELLSQAVAALVRGQMPRARALYREATERAPGNPDAWRGLGIVCSRMGERSEAARSLKRYLALRPNAPDAAAVQKRLSEL